MSIVTRFAPSPTGYLHLGSAFAALVAWRRARAAGGRFLLRLEDIDTSRCRPEFAAAVIEDLVWLGLDWDGPVRVQTEHLPDYHAVLTALSARGLLYRCFCTRSDIARAANAPHGPDGPIYPGTCRHLPPDANPGKPYALRLDIARALDETGPLTWDEEGQGRLACDPAAFGDIVLARRETPCSYHLCVTHDDALQGVTLVTRGDDLRPATAIHRLLQTLMGWPEPRYHHHAVLTDVSGRRLAKRDEASTIRSMRVGGMTPGTVLAWLAQTSPGGLAPTQAEV
jgi:glutamyl-Q tRNA(Asp) synthetase